MRSSKTPLYIVGVLAVAIAGGLIYVQSKKAEFVPPPAASAPVAAPSAAAPSLTSPAPEASPMVTSPQDPSKPAVAPASPVPAGVPAGTPDLSVDANGLSKATVVIQTNQGVIKYKFYPKDAPNTVNRMIELIQKGFYNGLTFHRVVPRFVIQGGDPNGNGTGGSGQKMKAEFNKRPHIEGTVAMARAQDPDSADAQFYIALERIPHLDGSYTVFGQVIEGMDAVKKIQIGDKMISVTIQ
ncbi:peptidylprolyl isomerase [Bdellovibrionota bacterium FG-2]